MTSDLRIVFMGTPEFAVATLDYLLARNCNIVAVVTAPDKPSGRGRRVTAPAVKEFALTRVPEVLQPENLKDPAFADKLRSLKPDLFIVVAFRMLPELIWSIPRIGTFNLHASLLPQYRGAAPINHAIINGEKETGVTTFFIDSKIDTGNILLREEVQIEKSDNAGTLHDKLMVRGADLVLRTIEGLASGSLQPRPQSEFTKPGELLKPAPKIFPEDCNIDWKKDISTIHNLIRGLSPVPCARSILAGSASQLSFKIFQSRTEVSAQTLTPGTIITDRKSFMKVAAPGGYIEILELQPEGKKKMSTGEFLRGFRPDENIAFL
jgi:methionyl-tRNA formyltransferase